MARGGEVELFTWRQGLAAGHSWRELRGPRFQRLLRNVYAPRGATVDVVVLVRAARLVVGEHAVASHETAARIWGAAVPPVDEVHLTVPPGTRRARREGVRVHAGARRAVVRSGVPVTTPAETFLDLSARLRFVDLVILGDSLVQAGATTPDELRAAAATWRGRNRRLAHRAAALVRAGAESPMETRARLLLVLSGLPEPVLNHALADEDGVLLRRLDLAYVRARLAIEYDGRHHAESTRQWQGDIRRREELDRWGWRVVVLTASDIFRTPEETLRRVRLAMADCGMRVPPMRDEWRRHFPERQG
ncbi:DUF559 domain-containing protein [Ornithinicoccus halotolerans]|uniref:DUF559 domain-containing protein n=1 Tax=Ornithinicoccus halotolerans TaxID=1748220 RepID=UPI0012978AF0|nr:DUF559 domain-containing protein [Ornithinicoccus halotolerans]